MIRNVVLQALMVLLIGTATARGGGAVWSAGAARVDITPEGSVWMAGYAARKSPSEGITQRLFAKALALRDGRGQTLLWITADLIGFDRAFTEEVASRIGEAHGVSRPAMALFASHTHCGPLVKNLPETLSAYGIDPDSEAARNNARYRRDLEDRLVALAGEALGRLRPARLSHGVGQSGFAVNRREPTATGFKIGVNPDGPVDRSVPVLRVQDNEGRDLAITFGYACHNTTLGGDVLKLCGDYAGFAQASLEANHDGAVALFLTGCGGDANPHPRGTLELARSHGETLADAVEQVLAQPMATLSGELGCGLVQPNLRFVGPTDRASYEALLKQPGSGRQAHARRMLTAIDSGQAIRTQHPYTIQAFALGDRLTVLALAGEVVADYALRLKRELGGDGLWVAAYANDVFGYVGSARVIREGGYEGREAYYYSTFPTPLAEDTEELIVKSVHDLANQVRRSGVSGASAQP
jgi:hypothetical protein